MTPEVGAELVNPVAGTTTVFRATAASTAGAYVEVEATYPPHSAGPPMHLHPAQAEHFTVQTGRMCALVGGVQHDLGPGDVLDAVRADLLQVVHGTLQPTSAGLWLRDGSPT